MFAATRAGVMVQKKAVVTGPTYRYWRLSISAQNGDNRYAGLGEIQLRPVAGGATATTAQTPVSSSIASYAGWPLSNLVDGDLSTPWISASAPAFPFTVTLDLGLPTAINEVAISPQESTTIWAPSAFSVQGSDNGTTFSTVKSFSSVTQWVDGQFMTFAL